MPKPALEHRWDVAIADDRAHEVADRLLRIANTALEEAVIGIGRVLWHEACEQLPDRAGDAPLVEAIARVEPRLSRASMYRAIAVYRQSEQVPSELRGQLGPSRLYELVRLPDEHLEKQALARRAAVADMTVDALRAEVDQLLGVRRQPRRRGFGAQMRVFERALTSLKSSAKAWSPRTFEDVKARRAQLRRFQQLLAALEADLARHDG